MEGDPIVATPDARRFMDVDADVSAILDAEIEKQAEGHGGPMPGVRFTRNQMLRALLVRAVRCKCGARADGIWRPAPPDDAAPPRRRVVEVDDFVTAILDTQIWRYRDEGATVLVRRPQMLRFLVLRAARCTCG